MKHLRVFSALLAVGLLGTWLVSTAGARVGQVTGATAGTTGTSLTEGVRRDEALFVWCDRFMNRRILPKLNELLVLYEKQAACWRDARTFGVRGNTVGAGMLDRTSKCQKIDAAVIKLQKESMALLMRWQQKGCDKLSPKK